MSRLRRCATTGCPAPHTSSLVHRTSTASARTSSAGRSPAQSAPLGPACPPALGVHAGAGTTVGRAALADIDDLQRGGHSCPRGALRKSGWSQWHGKVPSVSRGARQPHHLLTTQNPLVREAGIWRSELRPPDQGQQTNREVKREAIRAENFWCSHSNTQLALVSPPPRRVAAVAAIDDPSPITGLRNGLPGQMACSGGEYEASRSPWQQTPHPIR